MKDAASILKIIAGYDECVSTSAQVPVPDYTKVLNGNIRGLRIGLPKEYYTDALNGEIKHAIMKRIEILQQQGVTVKEISLPHTEYATAAYYILTLLKPPLILHGMTVLAMENVQKTYKTLSNYIQSHALKGWVKKSSDALCSERMCFPPATMKHITAKDKKSVDSLKRISIKHFEKMYLSDIYTLSAILAGIPGISIPCGDDHQGLPIGLQIIGKQFDEETILKVADFFEKN